MGIFLLINGHKGIFRQVRKKIKIFSKNTKVFGKSADIIFVIAEKLNRFSKCT